MGYELLKAAAANQSLERLGEQLARMERTVEFETEVMNQPTVYSTRFALR